MNKKLPGPEPLKYYMDPAYRLDWYKSKGLQNYWAAMYQGQHVADLFLGKMGWIAVVFGRSSFACKKRVDAVHHIVGMIIHRKQ